jgi:hypothetical protein
MELMIFRLRPDASEPEFLAADKRVQEEFAYRQPGLVRRTTARGVASDWIVVDLWQSAADADATAARWDADPVAQVFMAFVEPSSVAVRRYEPLP